MIVGGMVDLECLFQSIPPAEGAFLRDGVTLDESDSRITVVTTNTSAVLMISDVGVDDGGEYSCRFNNSVDTTTVDVTTLAVLSEYRDNC